MKGIADLNRLLVQGATVTAAADEIPELHTTQEQPPVPRPVNAVTSGTRATAAYFAARAATRPPDTQE